VFECEGLSIGECIARTNGDGDVNAFADCVNTVFAHHDDEQCSTNGIEVLFTFSTNCLMMHAEVKPPVASGHRVTKYKYSFCWSMLLACMGSPLHRDHL